MTLRVISQVRRNVDD